ncbi:AfsR/SARP family transcriptional regulator [Solihabitans fulvus]|uniref:AfsR/SARP family transcriptional regulator n=1 Tax=Solihabitans fulvus TaxID=1892852 RepID=A0A5B2XDM8_9PSEU|nr:BTAD domain-containing putative transcriptional regulator [Solihabitans fulvus]KAA2261061.1 AfsR/SARP family transcriptional regulator [Solihabitans fulvus]
MQFGILGPLEVRSAAGVAIPVGGPRPRALLVLLALHQGRVVRAAQLVAGQYGEDPPAGATNAVQAHVSRLRRGLPAGLIEFHGGGYRLNADPEAVDATRFERLAEDGRRLLVAGRPSEAATALREALGLWRGPALVDLPHGQNQAARLEDLRLAATEDLAEARLALPEVSPVADLRELVAAHPLRERARGLLLRALHAAGRPAEALAEFDDLRRLLADELGADPSPELAAIHLAILRAERPAPPGRRGPTTRLTSFTGRDRELARLAELRDTRLVTIVGPGGVGKTRLAVESVGPREACFVDLSTVDTGTQVPQAVLDALGLREPGFRFPATDPVRRLVAALTQDLLLVLDNCEHVVASVARLAATLLAECPRLAILATSREPLGLTGETLLPLGPLDTAPPDAPARDAVTYPAVRLFADRAAAVRPGFVVDRDTAGAVAGICAALDGLPLAIELAAARLRQFTVGDLAVRLDGDDRFRLLSRGDRTAAARHRTLAAAVAWSWDLLGPAERTLAARFAVFAGGAPLDTVAAVCAVPDTEDVLADLVDRSLVQTDGRRYRMLETIRLFCAERLAEAGESVSLRRAHAGHHLDLARRADRQLRGAGQLDWLARLSAEHENLLAALRWAAREDRATAGRLIAALSAYWWLSGRRSEVGAIAAELLDDVPAELERWRPETFGGSTTLPDTALAEEYVSCVVHAVPRAAPEHVARASRFLREIGPTLRHPFGAAVWGMAFGPWGPTPADQPPLATDPWNEALGLLSRGLHWLLGGRLADGERELRDVLARFRDLGDLWGTAQALDWLAHAAGWRGEWGSADELWSGALANFERLGAGEECVDVLCRRAECATRRGDLDGAAEDYRRAAELSASAGRAGAPPSVQLGLGELARRRGATREAAALLGGALESAQAGDFGSVGVRVRALVALGRLSGAADRFRDALVEARRSPLSSDLAVAVEGAADAALLTGRAERAAWLLGVAVALRGTTVAGQLDVARTAELASDLLGASASAEAFAMGAALTPDEALTSLDAVSREPTLTTPDPPQG